MMNNPMRHLCVKTACHKALDGILQIECSGCHILTEVDTRIETNLPICNTCGPVIWNYPIAAVAILGINGFLDN